MSPSKRARERRSQILERALGVFAEKGYHGASVSDIVRAAAIARGTFYLYFDSKEAVFHELLDALLATMRGSIRGVELGPGHAPVESQLRAIVAQILRTTERNRELTRILFREAVGLDATVEAKLRAFHHGIHAWLVAALEEGEARGLIRPSEREVVATCIIGAVRQVIDRLVVQADAPFDADAVAGAVVGFSLEGLAPR